MNLFFSLQTKWEKNKCNFFHHHRWWSISINRSIIYNWSLKKNGQTINQFGTFLYLSLLLAFSIMNKISCSYWLIENGTLKKFCKFFNQFFTFFFYYVKIPRILFSGTQTHTHTQLVLDGLCNSSNKHTGKWFFFIYMFCKTTNNMLKLVFFLIFGIITIENHFKYSK